MKLTKTSILKLHFTLDNSECVMFNQGGRIDFKLGDVLDNSDESVAQLTGVISNADQVIISFQANEKPDAYFAKKCADEHLKNLTPEELEARENDRKRHEEYHKNTKFF